MIKLSSLQTLAGALLALAAAAPALAQSGSKPLTVVAVPPLPTRANVKTEGGDTGVIGIQIAQLIQSDLASTGAIFAFPPDKLRVYTPTEAAAPQFAQWQSTRAGALVTGFVEARSDGRLTVACYLHDIAKRRELTRKGFVVAATDWRRAAHRCADAFAEALTGQSGNFDSRLVYVAESGPKTALVKRLATMDFDGTGHRYLTTGEVTVLSPRLSPDGRLVAYVSFSGGQPHVRLLDIESGADRPLVRQSAPSFPSYQPLPPPTAPAMTFAPSFSPDGRFVVFAMAQGGNTDIFVASLDGGPPQPLTSAIGTDTAPHFSPDGSQIAFQSDRSGTQQIYVMNADGTSQRRISFGGGAYASPVWSPDGEWIAFTRLGSGSMRIGILRSASGEERMLTDGWRDESPAWAPGGRSLVFQRTEQGAGRVSLQAIAVAGGRPRKLMTPQDGSDPSWGASK
jgi:TolB protein